MNTDELKIVSDILKQTKEILVINYRIMSELFQSGYRIHKSECETECKPEDFSRDRDLTMYEKAMDNLCKRIANDIVQSSFREPNISVCSVQQDPDCDHSVILRIELRVPRDPNHLRSSIQEKMDGNSYTLSQIMPTIFSESSGDSWKRICPDGTLEYVADKYTVGSNGDVVYIQFIDGAYKYNTDDVHEKKKDVEDNPNKDKIVIECNKAVIEVIPHDIFIGTSFDYTSYVIQITCMDPNIVREVLDVTEKATRIFHGEESLAFFIRCIVNAVDNKELIEVMGSDDRSMLEKHGWKKFECLECSYGQDIDGFTIRFDATNY